MKANKAKTTRQETKTRSNTDPTKNWGRTQALMKGNLFLLLILLNYSESEKDLEIDQCVFHLSNLYLNDRCRQMKKKLLIWH